MEVIIKLSDRPDKRYMAVFYDKNNKVKTTHFGYAITDDKGIKKYGSTYIDHKNDELKSAYIARHQVNEDFSDYMSAGSLAFHILWNKKSLRESIADYKRRFRLD
jgi:predicted solute-binding protein